jgi:hypothetical protein
LNNVNQEIKTMFFYREEPTQTLTPPSQSNLRFWLDAQDLTVADGTEILTMNNKGTLGGTFIQRSDIPITDKPTADTVDGKRAISWAANQTHGLISTEIMTYNSPITILTLTRNEANQTSGVPNGAPYNNGGRHLDLGYNRIQLRNEEGWSNYPNGYSNLWRVDSGLPIEINIDTGTVSAILVHYDRTLVNTNNFFKIKKDSSDTITTRTPRLSAITSSPMLVGGAYGSAGGGGYINSFAGKMFEIMVWEGIVDDSSVRTYLGQKYGGIW